MYWNKRLSRDTTQATEEAGAVLGDWIFTWAVRQVGSKENLVAQRLCCAMDWGLGASLSSVGFSTHALLHVVLHTVSRVMSCQHLKPPQRDVCFS